MKRVYQRKATEIGSNSSLKTNGGKRHSEAPELCRILFFYMYYVQVFVFFPGLQMSPVLVALDIPLEIRSIS